MKYFLDSAKLEEISYAYENWKLDGVTTNPRHILASGKGLFPILQELADFSAGKDFPISVEINPHLREASDMVAEAKKLAELSPNFCIKIPCTEQGLVAAKQLGEMSVPTNVTLVFSPPQALQAGRIGARFCSPFVGWREANGDDGLAAVEKIVQIYRTYAIETEVIVAAVRTAFQIVRAAEAGAHIVTAGFSVYQDSFTHPYTDHGNRLFEQAWDQTNTEPTTAGR